MIRIRNIVKKVICCTGYTLLRPVSYCVKWQKSRMTLAEAQEIVADVYDLNNTDQNFRGGQD